MINAVSRTSRRIPFRIVPNALRNSWARASSSHAETSAASPGEMLCDLGVRALACGASAYPSFSGAHHTPTPAERVQATRTAEDDGHMVSVSRGVGTGLECVDIR